jgi:hypothetical protein
MATELPPWVLRHAKFERGTISLIDESLRTGRRLRRPYHIWETVHCAFNPDVVKRGMSDPDHATGDKELAYLAFKGHCKNAGLGRRVKT